MAEEIRRRIRWENKEKQRKRREEKNKEREEELKRQQRLLEASELSNRHELCENARTPGKSLSLQGYHEDVVAKKRAPSPSPTASAASSNSRSSMMEASGPLFSPPLRNPTKMMCTPSTPSFRNDSDDDVDLLSDALLLAKRKSEHLRQQPPLASAEKTSSHARLKVVDATSLQSSVDCTSDSGSDYDLLRDVLLLKEKRKADSKDCRPVTRCQDEELEIGNVLLLKEEGKADSKDCRAKTRCQDEELEIGNVLLLEDKRKADSNDCRAKTRCQVEIGNVLLLKEKRKADSKDCRAEARCQDEDLEIGNVLLLKEKLKADSKDCRAERRCQDEELEIGYANRRDSVEPPLPFASLQGENGENREDEPCTPQSHPVSKDSLWSDSDSELPKPEEKRVKKRKQQNPTRSQSNKVARIPARRSVLRPQSEKSLSDEGEGSNSDDISPRRSVLRTQSEISLSDEGEGNNSYDSIEIDKLMPHFDSPKLGPPSDLVPLTLKYVGGERIVPASINRYLKGYQREGVVFMHNRISMKKGVILGDDMGLGKTVQVIALLAALLKKNGCGEDELELRKRRRLISQKLDQDRREQEQALRNGNVTELNSHIPGLLMPKWSPILVIVPPSVIENWMNEFEAWGHFGVVAFTGPSRDRAMGRIRTGLDEVMVCGRTMLQSDDDLAQVKHIQWKLIVIDEYHQYKNFRTKLYSGLKSLRESCDAPLVGLTGTLMQNNHEELWSEVDLVNPGFLGTWEEFKDDTSVPIKLGRTKTADDAAVEEGNQVRDWLKTKLKSFYLQRRKVDVLKDDLPEKNERVVFCELSPLQKRLYQHVMTLPDVVLVKYGNAPCECGINQAIFQGFKHMRTDKEKIAYQRNHRDDIVPRKSCCHKRPLNMFRFDDGQEFYDPRAPLWRWQHERLVSGEVEAGTECKSCPYCISFAVLDKLYKLSSHVSLLQLPKHPDDYVEGSRSWKDAQKALDFAKVAFPEDILDSLPGRSYIREDGIMDDHSNLSGKMKMLADLLSEFNRRDDRLLIFSFSTQTLDLIQNFVKAQGYSFLRLDGSTPTKARQSLVDKYQKDKNIFLFLISTKAGGLGLNLTAANVVIVFDVDFNPSNDEQSQDRAYRIGQKRDVLVIRLVSRGTIEELKYIRQLYKLQLKNYTIGSVQSEQTAEDAEAARMFRAVEGDKDRKGELFGMENLLKFKDGSFMDDLWKSTTKDNTALKGLERFGLYSAMDMVGGIEGMSEEGINDIGGNIVDTAFRDAAMRTGTSDGATNGDPMGVEGLLRGNNSRSHADYLRADRGDALFKPGDHGFEEEMGGYSQAEHYVMENADVAEECDHIENPPSILSTELTEVAPSPVRSAPFSARCASVPDAVDERLRRGIVPGPLSEEAAEERRFASALQLQNVSNMIPQRSIRAGGMSSAKTIRLGKKGSSLFSSKDLHIPGKKRKTKTKLR